MVYSFITAFLMAMVISGGCSSNGTKTDEKISAQYLLRQIIMEPSASEEGEAETLKRAEKCLEKALSGEDFTILAKTYSTEFGAKQTGGDLGFFIHEQMVKTFSDAVFSMKPGEIQGSVKTQFGYHIIKLLEIKDSKRHAQHILFQVVPSRSDTLAVLDTLSVIRKKILDGVNFTEMLQRYCSDSNLLKTDGYMVWKEPDKMLTSFSNAIKDIKQRDISEPFVSILGLHIVLVDSVDYDSDTILEGFPPYIEKRIRENR